MQNNLTQNPVTILNEQERYTADIIYQAIKENINHNEICIHEVPIDHCRIDALIINKANRLVHGIEIKVSKQDYNFDTKFTLYSEYCSYLSIACPENLISPEEIKEPFGLIYVKEKDGQLGLLCVKEPKLIQGKDTMKDISWLHTYIRLTDILINRLYFSIRDKKIKMKIPLDKTLEDYLNGTEHKDDEITKSYIWPLIDSDIKYPDLCIKNIRTPIGCKYDAMVIKRPKRHIHAYKIILNKEEYLNDWQIYFHYTMDCNEFTFICPKGMIKSSEVPDSIGLIYVWEENYLLESKIIKPSKAFRDTENDSVISWLFQYIKITDSVLDSLQNENDKLNNQLGITGMGSGKVPAYILHNNVMKKG